METRTRLFLFCTCTRVYTWRRLLSHWTSGVSFVFQADLSCQNTKQTVGAIYTRTNFVTLKYVTDSWGTLSNGFRLVITAVKDPSEYISPCDNSFLLPLFSSDRASLRPVFFKGIISLSLSKIVDFWINLICSFRVIALDGTASREILFVLVLVGDEILGKDYSSPACNAIRGEKFLAVSLSRDVQVSLKLFRSSLRL